jgi:hypothetical protein
MRLQNYRPRPEPSSHFSSLSKILNGISVSLERSNKWLIAIRIRMSFKNCETGQSL